MECRFISSLQDIHAQMWDALVPDGNPFVQHGFLSALETSGAVGQGTGWQPHHLLIYQGQNLIGAMALYVKSHSYGEYVFDHGWAQAYHQHGFDYYPKLVAAVPFTPVAGPRLLTKEPFDLVQQQAVYQALSDEAVRLGASSWHLLFPQKKPQQMPGIALREGTQFHWYNRGYQHFDDFLAALKARKRKAIKKERQLATEGLVIRLIEGPDITTSFWQRFYLFYQRTYLIRSGHNGYLPEAFFLTVGEKLPENVLLAAAFDGDEMVAASLFFKDKNRLYGRYWGALADFDRLHFECCYYQGIEYCIANGLEHFDAGAQGEHKIQRGFEPIATWSAHWLANADFMDAVFRFVNEEQPLVEAYRLEQKALLPFRESSL
ncbi:GNAT family N-acetyltransferase [Gallaecimonas mangrovi]|uniref:GNAT family N-acetyltransferase n=1 Tax=Gallaecimonas mangrovi TaxID=2291597 RepID=UPI000E1FFAEF|nr:GNAT family N-acetyltransferase [Gallaecimonas mangrovi]